MMVTPTPKSPKTSKNIFEASGDFLKSMQDAYFKAVGNESRSQVLDNIYYLPRSIQKKEGHIRFNDFMDVLYKLQNTHSMILVDWLG